MISNDVWGIKTEINKDNICIGSKLYNKKL
jgi:hypothetical protein